MLVAAAFCPAPPLLVPLVASGAAPELDDVRSAALQAIAELQAQQPDLLLVVGDGPAGECPAGTTGSLRGFGVELEVVLGARKQPLAAEPVDARAELPVSLTVGAWLLHEASWTTPVTAVAVPPDIAPDAAARIGVELAQRAERVALLVLGESSACLDARAPGSLDPAAAPLHSTLVAALANGDTTMLLSVEAATGIRLMMSGRAPWQVAAGAATGSAMKGALTIDTSPYGVGYVVATWTSQ